MTVPVSGEKVLRTISFLVELDTDSELAAKAAHIERLTAQLVDLPALVKKGEEALVEKGKIVDRLTKDKEILTADGKTASANYQKTLDIKRKMEEDLAKIRLAIGEKAMKEILAEEEKKP
jgi:hypothetical protein